MPVLLAIISAISYGSADFVGGYATKKTPVFSVLVFSQLAGTAVIIIAILFMPSESVRLQDMLWGAVAGLAGAFGISALYFGLATTTMAVVSPVAAVFGGIFPVLVGLAIGERPAWTAWLGMALAFPAIGLLTAGGQAEGNRIKTKRALLFGIAAGAGFGLFFITLSRTGGGSGLWPLLAARGASVSTVALIALITRRGLPVKRESLPPILASGILDMAANVTYLLAVRGSLLIITTIIVSLYPAPTVLLARAVLKERLNLLKVAGIVCAVAGVALLGL